MAHIETQTDWVCTECLFALAGVGEEEMGRPMPIPYDREQDSNIVGDPTLGTPIAQCDYYGEAWHNESTHADCDVDSFSTQPCDSCDMEDAGSRYAVTVSRFYA